jgi:outer membrane murein-binding lipoprotein Lpp
LEIVFFAKPPPPRDVASIPKETLFRFFFQDIKTLSALFGQNSAGPVKEAPAITAYRSQLGLTEAEMNEVISQAKDCNQKIEALHPRAEALIGEMRAATTEAIHRNRLQQLQSLSQQRDSVVTGCTETMNKVHPVLWRKVSAFVSSPMFLKGMSIGVPAPPQPILPKSVDGGVK